MGNPRLDEIFADLRDSWKPLDRLSIFPECYGFLLGDS